MNACRSIAVCSLFLPLLCALSCASGTTERKDLVCGRWSGALIDGSDAPPLPLTAGEQAAVGALLNADGDVHCTGTLIAERWVLSAAHCAPLATSEPLTFQLVRGSEKALLPVTSYHVHPESDVMLALLAPSSELTDGRVQPLARWDSGEHAEWQGRTLTLVGFGDREDGQDGQRRYLEEPVVEVLDDAVIVDGGTDHGACAGDSGGPLLGRDAAGKVRIIGVLSGGNARCRGRDRYVRVDRLTSWIQSVQQTVAEHPCEDKDWVGTCRDGQASWCNGTSVVLQTCAKHELCGWSAAESGYRCVDEQADPCEGAGPMGVCEGDTLRICRSGTLDESDCAACGLHCTWDERGARCE